MLNECLTMRFTSKFHCGIKTLVDIAGYDRERGVLPKEIANRNCMSLKFIDLNVGIENRSDNI